MNSAAIGPPFRYPDLSLTIPRESWPFAAAVLVSLMIHGLALGWLPGLSGRADPPRTLQVRVRLAPPLEMPIPAALPAPAFLPEAQVFRSAPEAVAQPSAPVLTRPMHDQGGDAPAIRSEPASLAAPVEAPRVGPVPVPLTPQGVTVDPGALAAFGRELAGAVAGHQRYPRVALLRQWQGTAVLQLALAADGRLLGLRVISSSGHDILDRQALDMVRETLPLPSLPEALAGRSLTVEVPVVFRIAS